MKEHGERPVSESELHAYVDEQLSDADCARVEAHLNANPDVAARVSDYIAHRNALREALAHKLQEDIPARLRVLRLAAGKGAMVGDWRAHWISAAAAALFAVLGAGGGWLARGEADSRHQPIDIAVGAHRVFVADASRPVEIRAVDQDQLERWLSNRLERTVSVPDLSAAGLRFMGGRLIPTPEGPAAQLMYDDDRGMRVTLFVEAGVKDHRAPRQTEVEGVDVESWAQEGFRYTLAAQTESRRVAELGAIVRAFQEPPRRAL
jgi:anti-sigma factor RsiW